MRIYKNNYIGMHYYSLLEYEFERLLKNKSNLIESYETCRQNILSVSIT